VRFDSCASEYDSHATPQRTFAERVAGFIGDLPWGTRESTILELGAGTGALTRWICDQPGVQICATDASPAMVEIGKSAVPSVDWRVLDAFSYPLFVSDLQVSSGLLQWAPNPVAALRHWKAALRSGGRMVHAFACEPCLQEWREVAPESPLTWRDESAWVVMFEEAGLRVRRKQLWFERVEFPSSLHLARSLHRSGVTGRPRLGTGQLREAMRRYERLFRSENGVFSTWAWMVVEAVAA
jgi:SAM-dependent methyltransferase